MTLYVAFIAWIIRWSLKTILRNWKIFFWHSFISSCKNKYIRKTIWTSSNVYPLLVQSWLPVGGCESTTSAINILGEKCSHHTNLLSEALVQTISDNILLHTWWDPKSYHSQGAVCQNNVLKIELADNLVVRRTRRGRKTFNDNI